MLIPSKSFSPLLKPQILAALALTTLAAIRISQLLLKANPALTQKDTVVEECEADSGNELIEVDLNDWYEEIRSYDGTLICFSGGDKFKKSDLKILKKTIDLLHQFWPIEKIFVLTHLSIFQAAEKIVKELHSQREIFYAEVCAQESNDPLGEIEGFQRYLLYVLDTNDFESLKLQYGTKEDIGRSKNRLYGLDNSMLSKYTFVEVLRPKASKNSARKTKGKKHLKRNKPVTKKKSQAQIFTGQYLWIDQEAVRILLIPNK